MRTAYELLNMVATGGVTFHQMRLDWPHENDHAEYEGVPLAYEVTHLLSSALGVTGYIGAEVPQFIEGVYVSRYVLTDKGRAFLVGNIGGSEGEPHVFSSWLGPIPADLAVSALDKFKRKNTMDWYQLAAKALQAKKDAATAAVVKRQEVLLHHLTQAGFTGHESLSEEGVVFAANGRRYLFQARPANHNRDGVVTVVVMWLGAEGTGREVPFNLTKIIQLDYDKVDLAALGEALTEGDAYVKEMGERLAEQQERAKGDKNPPYAFSTFYEVHDAVQTLHALLESVANMPPIHQKGIGAHVVKMLTDIAVATAALNAGGDSPIADDESGDIPF